MKGIGTVNQIENPFWTLVGKEGVERNPLKYYCAPNQATPDYVTSYSVRDFIAYGFVCCWDAVCPAYFAMWNMVQQDDVQWLRHYFLEVLEAAVLAYYEGKLENGENFDWGDWSQSLNIGNSDEGDEEEIRYTWALDRVDDENLAMVLAIANCVGTGPAGDDEVIWLAKEALEDRAKVKAAFEEAYAANKLHGKISEQWAEVSSLAVTEPKPRAIYRIERCDTGICVWQCITRGEAEQCLTEVVDHSAYRIVEYVEKLT